MNRMKSMKEVPEKHKIIKTMLRIRHVPEELGDIICDYVECLEQCEHKLVMMYNLLEVKYKVLRNIMIDVSFALHLLRKGSELYRSNDSFMDYVDTIEFLTYVPEERFECSIDDFVNYLFITETCITHFHKFTADIDEAYFNNFEGNELEQLAMDMSSFNIRCAEL